MVFVKQLLHFATTDRQLSTHKEPLTDRVAIDLQLEQVRPVAQTLHPATLQIAASQVLLASKKYPVLQEVQIVGVAQLAQFVSRHTGEQVKAVLTK